MHRTRQFVVLMAVIGAEEPKIALIVNLAHVHWSRPFDPPVDTAVQKKQVCVVATTSLIFAIARDR
jgi:hypothetical protein